MAGVGTRQHYVPQAFLKRFSSNPDGAKPEICVFDLDTRRRFRTGTPRIAAEDGFYDLDEFTTYDDTLTDVENGSLAAINRLVATRDLGALSVDDRLCISVFVLTLHLRGPRTRSIGSDMRSALVERLVNAKMTVEQVDELLASSGMDEQNDISTHVGVMQDLAPFAQQLVGRPWLLFHPPAGSEFATSDHPVIRVNDSQQNGLGEEGTALVVAFSPTLLLMIVDPRSTPLLEKQGTTTEIPFKEIYDFRLVDEASRFVFSRLPFPVRSMWLSGRGRKRIVAS